MYRQMLFYAFLFANWPINGQEDTNTKVLSMDVMCDKSKMTVHMTFSSPFNGLVYSHGNFDDSNCVYVKSKSNTLDTTFDINFETCGTISDSNGRYFENTVVIQYGADILGSDDETKRLRCEWHDTYQTSITQPVVRVSDPEPVVMNFQGDNIDCWMEILEGTSPRSRKVNGIVSLGSPMTLVIAMRDRSNQFDMKIKTCYAHDGHSKPIFLTDERGCILRTSLMSKFKKVRDTSGRANVICYAHFNAFKFPDSIDVYMQCTVEVCRFGCEESCNNEDDYGGHSDIFGKTKDANSKKLKDLFDKKLRDFHIQRLKKLRENQLRDLRNKRLKNLHDHFLKDVDEHTSKDSEMSEWNNLQNQRIKDLQEQKLKISPEKVLQAFQEQKLKISPEKALKTLQEQQLKHLHNLAIKGIQSLALKDANNRILKELQKKKLKDLRDHRLRDFHLHILGDYHANGDDDENTPEDDKTVDYPSSPFLWQDNGKFKDEETKIKSISFINSPALNEKRVDGILSAKIEPPNQIDNQTVAEVELSSSISVPTINTALMNSNEDVIKGSKVWISNPPATSIPEGNSNIKIRKPLMMVHDPMEEEGAMETSVKSVFMGVDSHGRTAMLPMPPEFARWIKRSNRRSIFKRAPPRVKLSLVSKTGRVLMRKYFYPVSPVIPIPLMSRGREKKVIRHRTKRSIEELGVMKSFKVISSQDLNFDPSIIRNEEKIFNGKQEISNENLCFTTTNAATIFALLSFIIICSFTMTGFLFYQYRIRIIKKCNTDQDTYTASFGKSATEDT